MKNIEEMIAVMTAYKELGKKIQYANEGREDWEDVGDLDIPCWDWVNYDYRVKQSQNLRPYANAKEFVDAMREHGIYNASRV